MLKLWQRTPFKEPNCYNVCGRTARYILLCTQREFSVVYCFGSLRHQYLRQLSLFVLENKWLTIWLELNQDITLRDKENTLVLHSTKHRFDISNEHADLNISILMPRICKNYHGHELQPRAYCRWMYKTLTRASNFKDDGGCWHKWMISNSI